MYNCWNFQTFFHCLISASFSSEISHFNEGAQRKFHDNVRFLFNSYSDNLKEWDLTFYLQLLSIAFSRFGYLKRIFIESKEYRNLRLKRHHRTKAAKPFFK